VELRQVDCFLAVAMDLHFGKAAKRLSLAQSSVSEAVNLLEKEVGGQLFVRTSRRVQLTPLGGKFRLGVEPAALVLRATLTIAKRPPLVRQAGYGSVSSVVVFMSTPCHLSDISEASSISMSTGWNCRCWTSLRRLRWVGLMHHSVDSRCLMTAWCNARSCLRIKRCW
jgi:DNA-binding transcriptional LysR family regulator